MKRIGIIGGSYNPPHSGHRHIADSANEELGLDEVWMWVSYNIFKDPSIYAPLAERTAMTRLLAEGRPWLKTMDMEKDFCDTMTATSLTTLKTLYPGNKFIWIFGDDNFSTFHTWNREKFKLADTVVPDWQYILNNFSVAVMNRPGYRDDAKNSRAAAYGKDIFIDDPKQLAVGGNGWTFLNNAESPISSTKIKQGLVVGARGIDGLPPIIENYIYDRGLFNTRADFNNAAIAPVLSNNKVEFATFLLLASTANLVKTVGLHNGIFDAQTLLNHAANCWDKSLAKGGFLNKADVPGELADCLISLYELASPQGISLPGGRHENQHSITHWRGTHYPGREIPLRMKDYIEELSELCVCEGLEKHRFLNLLRLVFDDPAADDLNAAFEKNYGVLKSYAEDIGEDLSVIVDNKMVVNRTRSPFESAIRMGAKESLISKDYN